MRGRSRWRPSRSASSPSGSSSAPCLGINAPIALAALLGAAWLLRPAERPRPRLRDAWLAFAAVTFAAFAALRGDMNLVDLDLLAALWGSEAPPSPASRASPSSIGRSRGSRRLAPGWRSSPPSPVDACSRSMRRALPRWHGADPRCGERPRSCAGSSSPFRSCSCSWPSSPPPTPSSPASPGTCSTGTSTSARCRRGSSLRSWSRGSPPASSPSSRSAGTARTRADRRRSDSARAAHRVRRGHDRAGGPRPPLRAASWRSRGPTCSAARTRSPRAG